jgi:Protein of unknown function (DUF3939)/Putative F0F1-ATPase subunit Ca2+/Mg2+ transporter
MKHKFTKYLGRVTVALVVFACYKLGAYVDEQYNLDPWFTLIGTFIGIGLGGLTGYVMVKKYFKKPVGKKLEHQPVVNPSKNGTVEKIDYPIIEITIDQVRKAVREFSENLPKGVYRTILVEEDNSIDFKQLAHILGGIPYQKYYMSKETYDLFEESEKRIPVEMDIVQKAVDLYVKDKKEYPMLSFDPNRRVNYYQLFQEHYLKSTPEIQFYITNLDGLITHIPPEKRKKTKSSP